MQEEVVEWFFEVQDVMFFYGWGVFFGVEYVVGKGVVWYVVDVQFDWIVVVWWVGD